MGEGRQDRPLQRQAGIRALKFEHSMQEEVQTNSLLGGKNPLCGKEHKLVQTARVL